MRAEEIEKSEAAQPWSFAFSDAEEVKVIVQLVILERFDSWRAFSPAVFEIKVNFELE
jgi:hypothetical protein